MSGSSYEEHWELWNAFTELETVIRKQAERIEALEAKIEQMEQAAIDVMRVKSSPDDIDALRAAIAEHEAGI